MPTQILPKTDVDPSGGCFRRHPGLCYLWMKQSRNVNLTILRALRPRNSHVCSGETFTRDRDSRPHVNLKASRQHLFMHLNNRRILSAFFF